MDSTGFFGVIIIITVISAVVIYAIFMMEDSNSDNEENSEKDNELICHNCDSEQNNIGALFCFNCGQSLFPKEFKEIIVCPDCNKVYDDTYKFCEIDGTQLVNETVEIQKKSITTSDDEITQTKNDDISVNGSKKDSFLFGNFIIGLEFVGGFSALIIFLFNLETDVISNRAFALVLSVFCLSCGWGLYKRRIFGLYMAYIGYAINILICISIMIGDVIFVIPSVIAIAIQISIIKYLYNREHLFTI